ncbi:TlpA disulfide reductase family protein [Limimaricola sp.]|uniref:TlpA family protein disulfide reductase n=1 Tax=Limimaricola sp. TaxID=2211665 RepID=UPI0025BF893D|nr:TlpA disulfide reductase family protein [Limimaricola sp.]
MKRPVLILATVVAIAAVAVAAVLYTSRTPPANAPAQAASADTSALAALRSGDMQKLALSDKPVPLPTDSFTDEAGKSVSFENLKGKVLLVNFWATWCAPCRKEMPTLAALQTALGSDQFQVVTIATGRNSPDAVARFFDEIGVKNLPRYMDPQQQIARKAGILGLPVTLIVDRQGQEVGRLQGDADWSSDSAKAILSAVIGQPGG